MVLDAPVDRILFGTNRRVNISRLPIQVSYSDNICRNSTTGAPLRVPQSNR